MKYLILSAVCLCVFASDAFAHGGGLNSEGCHNNRKTGGYHCHGSGSAPSPLSIDEQKAKNICVGIGLEVGTDAYAECVAAIFENAQ